LLRRVRKGVRVSNQTAVLETIHRLGPISRADIATLVNLSPAAVTNITTEFIARDLVFESRIAKSSRVGRPAVLLELDYSRAHIAGFKVSNVGITCAVTDLKANVEQTVHESLSGLTPEEVVQHIAETLNGLDKDETTVDAVGVSVPGIVALDQKTVRHSPLLGWTDVPLGQMLEDETGLDVLIENDVNAMALAEAWFGVGQGHDSFLVVTLGRGIGLGIVLNGEVYRGPNGGAGEFGHVLLDPEGPATASAKSGTVEAYLSDDALLRALREKSSGQESDLEQLTLQASEGSAELRAVFEQTGEILGRALSMLVNIFAPSLIILSGEGMRGSDLLLPAAEKTLKEASFGDLSKHLELVVDPWGDDAWARGAAGLAARRYLTDAALKPGGG